MLWGKEMLKVTQYGDIRIPRGDSGYFEVRKCKDGEVFPFSEGDTLTFTVKRTAKDPVLIQKTVTSFSSGVAQFRIDPIDTANLDFGIYRFDVQAKSSAGDVDTLVGPANFIVGEEITDEKILR